MTNIEIYVFKNLKGKIKLLIKGDSAISRPDNFVHINCYMKIGSIP